MKCITMSILDGAEIKEHVPCDRCHHGCSGPCPDCGAFEHHDEPHAPDCTIEETMRQLTVGIEGAR